MQKLLHQRSMMIWGILLLSGYLMSFYYLDNQGWLLISWASIGLVAIATKYILRTMHPTKRNRTIDLLWYGLIGLGLILSYLEYIRGVNLPITMLNGWFYLGAIGYFATAYVTRKRYCRSLGVLYLCAGASLYLVDLNHAILLSGLYFFMLCMFDAGLYARAK